MNAAIQVLDVIKSVGAMGTGGLIGYGFGLIQSAAQRRNQKRELEGKFKSAWGVMPGSGFRVACLLIALVLVQIICPLLFNETTKWWISGGVVLGYGFVLFRSLRAQIARGK